MTSDKMSILTTKAKKMYLARRIGDGPITVFETQQFLDKSDRVWELSPNGMTGNGRCAIASSEDLARTLVMWGPLVDTGSSNRQDTSL